MESKLTYHQLYYLKNKEKLNSKRNENYTKNKDKNRTSCELCNKSYCNKYDIKKHYLSKKHINNEKKKEEEEEEKKKKEEREEEIKRLTTLEFVETGEDYGY